jgi:CheY-like chemotaxis protein
VSSRVGSGSTFSLLLPAAGPQARIATLHGEEIANGTDPSATGGQPRVMLVEDDPSVRDATRMLLRVEGYQVLPIASAEEAVAAVDGGARFDLLMTDYHLGPNQTGIQVISALRERLGPQLKAILVTGDTSSAIRALSPDPQLRILSKPIRAEALLRLMREFLTGEEST